MRTLLCFFATLALGAEPVSHLVKLDTGVTLHVATQGRPGGHPLVLIHGIGDPWHSWERVLPLLPDTYRVHAVSLRGHGYSDHPPRGYSGEDYANDVLALLEKLNLRGITLVGHSLGSFVAQAVAVRDQGRVAQLILIGSSAGGVRKPETQAALREAFGSLRDPIDPQWARDFQASTIGKPIPAPFFETMTRELTRAAAAVFRETAERPASDAVHGKLGSLKIPVLLLWGEQDTFFGRAAQDELLKTIPGAKLIAYPGLGHTPHWEDPARVARDIQSFAPARRVK